MNNNPMSLDERRAIIAEQALEITQRSQALELRRLAFKERNMRIEEDNLRIMLSCEWLPGSDEPEDSEATEELDGEVEE